jgi:flavin-binding protein dodecin
MSSSEQEVEKAIQQSGATAPRLTPNDIDAAIVSETYTTLPSGKVMVCELTLRNGFTVRGEAATVSKANFDDGIGRRISRANARDKVWELEGYLLQQRLSEQ